MFTCAWTEVDFQRGDWFDSPLRPQAVHADLIYSEISVVHFMSLMMKRMAFFWDSILSVSLNWTSALARLCSWWLALK